MSYSNFKKTDKQVDTIINRISAELGTCITSALWKVPDRKKRPKSQICNTRLLLHIPVAWFYAVFVILDCATCVMMTEGFIIKPNTDMT